MQQLRNTLVLMRIDVHYSTDLHMLQMLLSAHEKLQDYTLLYSQKIIWASTSCSASTSRRTTACSGSALST